MKNFKKIMALIIACVMTIGMMSTMAFADGELAPQYIKLAATDNHTYNVYQVLTGTLATAGSAELGNPKWGADVKATVKTGENAETAEHFIDRIKNLTGKELADAVAEVVDITGDGRGSVTKNAAIEGLAIGYYVLVDKTDLTQEAFKNDTAALNVVQVLNSIDALAIKHDTTSDDKIITTDTLGKDEGTNTINGSTDNVSVGDTVSYKINAKVPAKATDYNYFYFIMNDTLSEGLTFTTGSLSVYHGSIDDAHKLTAGTLTEKEGGGFTATGDYVVKYAPNADGKTFEVALNNAKAFAGETIYVTYSAVLNEKAKIGELANENTENVKFSNNPNDDYDGANYPGFPGTDEDGAFGETPEKKTYTYTTGIEIQKVDQDGNVLTGATFEISGTSTKTVLTVAETFTEATGEEAKYWKLKNGTYTKEAPTAEGTYMKPAEAGATEGYVEDSSYTGDNKLVVDGKTYRPYVPETDAGKDIYVATTGNGHLYESTTTKYKKTVTKTANDAKTTHKVAKAVDTNGLVRFDGLGAGTYTIKETVTPGGYNTVPDLDVTVTFSKDGTPHWSFTGGEGAYDGDEGIYKITIENNKGITLPTTGGIGTTIFYILGGILILGAAIALIGKKRFAR